jgi:hypothetical protein
MTKHFNPDDLLNVVGFFKHLPLFSFNFGFIALLPKEKEPTHIKTIPPNSSYEF